MLMWMQTEIHLPKPLGQFTTAGGLADSWQPLMDGRHHGALQASQTLRATICWIMVAVGIAQLISQPCDLANPGAGPNKGAAEASLLQHSGCLPMTIIARLK